MDLNDELPTAPLADCRLRAAEASDVEAVFDLDRRHMKPAVDRFYPGAWDEDQARAVIVENLARTRIAELGGRMAGVYYWWMEPPSTAVLHSVQVVEQHRNQGLGSWLMACFEHEAKAAGARTAGLAVFEGNPALAFYERHGYRVIGEDGPHAVEMAKTL